MCVGGEGVTVCVLGGRGYSMSVWGGEVTVCVLGGRGYSMCVGGEVAVSRSKMRC